MKANKKFLTYIILAALLFSFASGCGQHDNQIAFFLYDGSDTFISEMMSKMTSKLPAGTAAEIRDAGNSQTVQNQQIVELAEDGVKLFVINAVDRLACSSIAEKCASEGIKVIFFNREPLEDALRGDNVYYVGAAADSLGKKQADMVAELFGSGFQGGRYDRNDDGVVQLVILKGEQGHQDAEKRTENCVNRLKELGFEVEVLAVEVADWNREDAYEAMRQIYSQYGEDIELLFANNDDMALGAIDYMLEIEVFTESDDNYDQPFVVVGVDATAVGLEAIERGFLYGTVNNDSDTQSDAILLLADYLLNKRDMADFPYEITNRYYIYIDGEIITRENIGNR